MDEADLPAPNENETNEKEQNEEEEEEEESQVIISRRNFVRIRSI